MALLRAELVCKEPISSEQALGTNKRMFLEGLQVHEKERLKDSQRNTYSTSFMSGAILG